MNAKGFGFRFGAIIPAAGMSSRMGAFKPLLPFGDGAVIENTVGAVLPYAERVVVVLGNRAAEVREVLLKRFGDRVITAVNPDYARTDMLRSVQIGLGLLGGCDGFFLLPGDMPTVGGEVFASLIGAFDGGSRVLYPTFEGRKGHPPLIGASLIPEICSYRGEGGLRAVLQDVEPIYVEQSDRGITVDLDTPGDYDALVNGSGKTYDKQHHQEVHL